MFLVPIYTHPTRHSTPYVGIIAGTVITVIPLCARLAQGQKAPESEHFVIVIGNLEEHSC